MPTSEQRSPAPTSPSPLNGDFIPGRYAGLVRGVVNVVIGTLAAGASERLAVGDTRGAVITAAVDGGIIIADALATAYIARRQRRIALLDEFSNVDTTGTNGSSAVVQSANNFVNTDVALTVTLSAFSNSNNATYGGFANWGGDPLNTGSGFTQVSKDTSVDTVLTEFKNTNDTTVDADGGGANQEIGGIAVEIKSQ